MTAPDDPTRATVSNADAPATDLGFLGEAIRAADASAFVHVGDRFDPDVRYLTGFSGPDRPYAFVAVPGRATLCAPALFEAQAEREFVDGAPDDGVDRAVDTDAGGSAGERAAAALGDLLGADAQGATVLAPRRIPHDAAVSLEHAGYDLAATPAVAEARAVKTAAELARLRAVQRAATRGMARAETVLAAADPDDAGERLRWKGDLLSTGRLRREVNAALAAEGVGDAGNTVIGAGPSCADLHYAGDDPIRPGETVLIDLSPRGPRGYHGDLTRTFTVDGAGGWDRRAYVAVDAARRVALAELRAGVEARTVHEEAAAELAAYGFEVGGRERGFVHGVGHGVGLALHEAPSLTGGAELEAGHVVTVEPGVYDPERGDVRIEDLAVVTEDGHELLAEYPRSLTPGPETR